MSNVVKIEDMMVGGYGRQIGECKFLYNEENKPIGWTMDIIVKENEMDMEYLSDGKLKITLRILNKD